MSRIFLQSLVHASRRTLRQRSSWLASASASQSQSDFLPAPRLNFESLSPFTTMRRGSGQRFKGSGKPDRKRKKRNEKPNDCGKEEVLALDVKNLLSRHSGILDDNESAETSSTVVREPKSRDIPETEVTVAELSSTGDGLALSPARDHIYVVPFTVPEDKVRVKVHRTIIDQSYSETELVEVIAPSPQRDDSLINCKYFGACSGCQYQMIPYEDQLQHKKRVVEKAYANFSGLLPELIPAVRDTFGSPLQFGYRTKLTPHFSKPQSQNKSTERDISPDPPAIGFMRKGRRSVLDIEDCPLGTDIVRQGFKKERKRVIENIDKFKNGATILVRETTSRKTKTIPANGGSADKSEEHCAQLADEGIIRKEFDNYIEEKDYITDPNGTSAEYIDNHVFYTKAGAFFQNNNSILSPFIGYIRENAQHPAPAESSSSPHSSSQPVTKQKIKYLLDAYCGSGLFAITLSKLFLSSLGVDISEAGIESARVSSKESGVTNASFTAADAAGLFQDVPYPPDQTLLIIDPPRKGCDENFRNQMLAFGPARVIYVSCNVHSQARDVGMFVQGGKGCRYEVESIRGFDFFPQTSHVESVAVLNRVE